jgi:hypothetical protein
MVGSEQIVFSGRVGREPFDEDSILATEQCVSGKDALGILGMPGSVILGAIGMMNDDHSVIYGTVIVWPKEKPQGVEALRLLKRRMEP